MARDFSELVLAQMVRLARTQILSLRKLLFVVRLQEQVCCRLVFHVLVLAVVPSS